MRIIPEQYAPSFCEEDSYLVAKTGQEIQVSCCIATNGLSALEFRGGLSNQIILFLKLSVYIYIIYTGCSKKHVTILNGYNFFNIHGRYIKQKSTESRDFKILLHLSIYFSNIFPEATKQF